MATATIAEDRVESGPEPWAAVTLEGVDWETYCRLRDEPENDHVRMSYLDGTLILMSPQYIHDFDSRRFLYVVTAVAEAYRIEFEPAGSTTLRRESGAPRRGAGKESDESFFLGADAVRVRDNVTLDLEVDPPTSLAIEVDNKADSSKALATYARLGVPEVWRYQARKKTLWFGRLAGEGYEEIARSVVLPRLTPALVLQALEARAGGMGSLDWLEWLRDWARGLPGPPATG